MRKLLLPILCLLILIPIVAQASTIQLPATGQTASLATGDDGAVQAGKPWPVPRFIDNHNGTVGDNLTGLIWSREANPLSARSVGTGSGGEITWQKALDEIKQLNTKKYLGNSDWRLPNLNELASLVHQGEPVQSLWLGRQGFTSITSVRYWSSSSVAREANLARSVHMEDGVVGASNKSDIALVWPVRSVSSVLPATGQVACSDTSGLPTECSGTGQDGELRMGVPWSVPRFVNNGDGTITDNLTGLIWPQNANPTMAAHIARAADGSTLWPPPAVQHRTPGPERPVLCPQD